MTWLKFLNVYFFQWFFVRLTKHIDRDVVIDYQLLSWDIMHDGNISARGIGDKVTLQWYSIQNFIIPTTGWSTNYKYIGKGPKFLRITKKKIVS